MVQLLYILAWVVMDTSALSVLKPGFITGQPVQRRKPAGLLQKARQHQSSLRRQERLVVSAVGSDGKDKAKLKLGKLPDWRLN